MRHDNGDNADDNDNDDEDDGLIFTSWNPTQPSAPTIRPRLFGPRHREKPKSITTTPGLLGAGETETEADEPVRSWCRQPFLSPLQPISSVCTVAQAFADSSHHPGVCTPCTTKHPPATSHAFVIRIFSLTLYCSRRLRNNLQSLPRLRSAHHAFP